MDKRDIVIALDEGTSNVKAVAIDDDGNVVAKASIELSIITPQVGWVEQDGKLLVDSSIEVIRQVINMVGSKRVAALAISNQRETVIAWSRKNGSAISSAITWQCSRSAQICDDLKQADKEDIIRAITGLPIAPLFSGSKMSWLLDAIPNARDMAKKGDICLGTIDSWLLWNFTSGQEFKCDTSNASRTQLLNLDKLDWDEDMLSVFNIPKEALPRILPSSSYFGVTKGLSGIDDGIPILSMIGDSHAALYGHGLGKPGTVKATFGTGSSVMAPLVNSETRINQLATSVAWHDGDKAVYALEGNIPHTGDAISWMLQVTGINAETLDISGVLQEMPEKIDSTNGVYFVPALTGYGAPWWDERARGLICGLNRGTTQTHLVRAGLESIAYQIADVIDTMKLHPSFYLDTLMVDGGPTRNSWLMQFQADLLGCPVARCLVPELSALGAGLLARRLLNKVSDLQLEKYLPQHDIWEPNYTRHTRYQESWGGWKNAVQRTLWQ